MTLLDTRLPNFPENPGDGFQIKETTPDGFVLWTYSEQFNQWTYKSFVDHYTGYVYTDQVLTRETTDDIATQQDVNQYMADALSQRVAALEAALVSLQVQLGEAADEPASFAASTGRRRARNADGTFRGDDPSTPDVNEAWVDGEA